MRFRVLLDELEVLSVEGGRNEQFDLGYDVTDVNHVRFELTATRDLCGRLSNLEDIGAFGDPVVE